MWNKLVVWWCVYIMDRRVYNANWTLERHSTADLLSYVKTLKLEEALFWFIENNNEDPVFTDIYFYLRERYIKESQNANTSRRLSD